MKSRKALSTILAIAMILSLLPAWAFAEDEGASRTVPVSSIEALEAAIEDAQEGDVITLAPGEYAVTANYKMDIDTDNVTIQGPTEGIAIIDCGDKSVSGQAGLMIRGDNVTVENLTVKSSAGGNVAAIKVTKVAGAFGLPMVENATIRNVTLESQGHGLNIHGVDGITVDGITANTYGKLGISLAYAKDVLIQNTTIGQSGWKNPIGTQYADSNSDYEVPVQLTLGSGNVFNGGAIYNSRPFTSTGETDMESIHVTAVQGGTAVFVPNWMKITATNSSYIAGKINGANVEGSDYYGTLANSVKGATSGQTVKLLTDVVESVTIPADKSLTLNLNGKKITNSVGQHTITNNGTLTITGNGTVYNDSKAAVYNNAEKALNITGGTFAAPQAVQNWGTATISGGTMNGSIATYNQGSDQSNTTISQNAVINGKVQSINYQSATNAPIVEITGGLINGQIEKGVDNGTTYTKSNDNSLTSTIIISGGNFTADPSAFVAEGKVAKEDIKTINGITYNYSIGDKTAEAVEVKGAAPAIDATDVTLPASGPAKEAADAVVSAISDSAGVTGNVPTASATTIMETFNPNSVSPIDNPTIAESENLTYVIAPYIDVKINSIEMDGDTVKEIDLDISAKYNVIATSDPGTLDVDDLDDSTDEKVATALPMTVNTPVTIAIELPEAVYNMLSTAADTAFVKHIKTNANNTKTTYYYPLTLSEDGGKYFVTFTTTHGFSPFAILVDTRKGTVAFDAGTGGTTTAESEEYTAANVNETLPTATKPGYTFTGWKIEGKVYTKLTDELLTVISEATDQTVTAEAQFSVTSSGGGSSTAQYDITISADDTKGAVDTSVKSASSGTKVTLTVTPKENYEIASVTVTDADGKAVDVTKDGEGKYSFTMPASAVTVKVEYKDAADCPSKNYADVISTAWYHDAIDYALEHGIMSGYSTTAFGPNDNLDRGMMCQILYNMEKRPAVASDAQFTDVAAGAWYADAVNWAGSNRIVSGYGNGLFGPTDKLTREQMATILLNYANYKKLDTAIVPNPAIFPDSGSISAFAITPMQWAVAEGLITGMEDGRLDPTGLATRAQMATIMMRFCESFKLV